MAAWPRRGRNLLRSLPLALAVLTAAAGVRPAAAQVGSTRYASIVEDAASGAVLEQAEPDAPRHPASLAKLMTLYMTFEAVRDRRIGLDEQVPVTLHAAMMEPTKLGLLPGTRITVEEAILGLVTRSANDAAAALGELLGGTEPRFAQMMTLRARALGMSRTTFTNASGLPDPDEWTTARDLALLARRLVADFPGYYHYFSSPSFVFHGQVSFNHDSMLKRYPGADGMKTGYTVASGHNLVTSAVRGGRRLIGVTLGCATNTERDTHMTALLNAAFIQEGVPVDPRAGVMAHSGFPGLISSAAAAEPERRSVASARPTAHLRPVAASLAGARHWTIQVGRFRSEKAALAAASRAAAADGGETRIERTIRHGRGSWRAEVIGLTPSATKGACGSRARHRNPCFVTRGEGRQVASL